MAVRTPGRQDDDIGSPPISRAALATFLSLTFSSSAVIWWMIIGGAAGCSSIFMLMWCPGTSALVTRLSASRAG